MTPHVCGLGWLPFKYSLCSTFEVCGLTYFMLITLNQLLCHLSSPTLRRECFFVVCPLTSSSHAERSPPRPPRPSAAPQTNTTSLHASPAFQAKRRSKRRSFSSRQPLAPLAASDKIAPEFAGEFCPPPSRRPLLSSMILDADWYALDDGGKVAPASGAVLVASTPPMTACFCFLCVVFYIERSRTERGEGVLVPTAGEPNIDDGGGLEERSLSAWTRRRCLSHRIPGADRERLGYKAPTK